jgi:hypothetical protein
LGTTFDMFRSRVAFIELFATESRTAHHHRRDGGRKRGMRAYRNGVLSMTKMRTRTAPTGCAPGGARAMADRAA